jgi:hypothetical protein
MVAIVGLFYQGQERRMDDEPSVIRAAEAATDWLIDKGYTNVLVEVANEADNAGFKHDVIKPSGGAVQLIERLKERSKEPGDVASRPASRQYEPQRRKGTDRCAGGRGRLRPAARQWRQRSGADHPDGR